jgi:hypothetical protein
MAYSPIIREIRAGRDPGNLSEGAMLAEWRSLRPLSRRQSAIIRRGGCLSCVCGGVIPWCDCWGGHTPFAPSPSPCAARREDWVEEHRYGCLTQWAAATAERYRMTVGAAVAVAYKVVVAVAAGTYRSLYAPRTAYRAGVWHSDPIVGLRRRDGGVWAFRYEADAAAAIDHLRAGARSACGAASDLRLSAEDLARLAVIPVSLRGLVELRVGQSSRGATKLRADELSPSSP